MDNGNSAKVGVIASIVSASATFLFAVLLVGAIRVPELNYLSYLVCFILAPAIVIMTAAIHSTAPSEKKIYTRIALVFAAVYAVFCTLTYYVQLAFVRPNLIILPSELLRIFNFAPGTFMFTVDMLGYAFLCLSTLFASAVFDRKREPWLKLLYIVNGLFFLPTLIFPALPFAQDTGASSRPSDIFGTFALLFWCFVFVPLSLLTYGYFRKIRDGK